MSGRFWKLAGLWTAACLGWIGYVFVAVPAWDTAQGNDGIPSGTGIFLIILVMTFVAWFWGVAVIWAVGWGIGHIRRAAKSH